jgi:hypothetical protein
MKTARDNGSKRTRNVAFSPLSAAPLRFLIRARPSRHSAVISLQSPCPIHGSGPQPWRKDAVARIGKSAESFAPADRGFGSPACHRDSGSGLRHCRRRAWRPGERRRGIDRLPPTAATARAGSVTACRCGSGARPCHKAFRSSHSVLDIPTSIPPVNLSDRFDPRDYTGVGRQDGRHDGVRAIDTIVSTSDTYLSTQSRRAGNRGC